MLLLQLLLARSLLVGFLSAVALGALFALYYHHVALSRVLRYVGAALFALGGFVHFFVYCWYDLDAQTPKEALIGYVIEWDEARFGTPQTWWAAARARCADSYAAPFVEDAGEVLSAASSLSPDLSTLLSARLARVNAQLDIDWSTTTDGEDLVNAVSDIFEFLEQDNILLLDRVCLGVLSAYVVGRLAQRAVHSLGIVKRRWMAARGRTGANRPQ